MVKKKSPFEKHKEELEAKKKVCSPLYIIVNILCVLQQADDEAAKVYEEFVASFSGDAPKSKGFVRGETYVPPNSIIPTAPAPAPPVATQTEEKRPSKFGLAAPLSAFSAFSDSGPDPVFPVITFLSFILTYNYSHPSLPKRSHKRKRDQLTS